MLVDSHCHLDFEDFEHDLDAVLARAAANGVGTMLTIGTRLREFAKVRAIAERHDRIYCSVGVHPHEAASHADAEIAGMENLAGHPKVIGIGEAGLDFHYDHSPRDRQRVVFAAQIATAKAAGLPLIVHCRNADAEMCEMLDAAADSRLHGVIHCFSSSRKLSDKALEIGFYISLSGIVTFKNASELREIAKGIPLDRLLVETDAPYLAPVPHRGKRNEPALVAHTAAAVAGIKGISLEELAAATTDNFFRLFDSARDPRSP